MCKEEYRKGVFSRLRGLLCNDVTPLQFFTPSTGLYVEVGSDHGESPNDECIHFSPIWSWWSERLSPGNDHPHTTQMAYLYAWLVDPCLPYYLIPSPPAKPNKNIMMGMASIVQGLGSSLLVCDNGGSFAMVIHPSVALATGTYEHPACHCIPVLWVPNLIVHSYIQVQVWILLNISLVLLVACLVAQRW